MIRSFSGIKDQGQIVDGWMPSAMPGGAGAFPQVVLLLLSLLVKFGTCIITLSADFC